MKKVIRRLFRATLLVLPNLLFTQTTKQDSIWKPLKYFIVKWGGTSEGESGKVIYERSYQFIFNGKFIESFDIAAPNSKYKVYSLGKLVRR